MHNRKVALIVILAILTLSNVLIIPAFSVDTLTPADFSKESFEKTVDFLDYARANALANGRTPPSEDSHAYLYLTYVNTKGMQMMYGGLINITDGTYTVTLPIQSWMMHYKSKNDSRDLVIAGSFIMLLAFAENATTKYPDSPDKNDTLFASLNLGFDMSSKFGSATPPRLSSKTEIIPLTSTNDGLNWHWGMRYTNMTAIWWQTNMDPLHPRKDFIAITRYDELTFIYDLALNPTSGTATLTASYVIGKITDLWLFAGGMLGLLFPGLLSIHYNSTGGYGLDGRVLEDTQNVYQFLRIKGIKMSVVQFQSTVVLDHTATFESDGTNVEDTEANVGNSNIATKTDEGETIFNANFGSKKTYRLYNYTEDPNEIKFKTYNTTTRTVKAANLATNPIFALHTILMRYIPLVLANMDNELYKQAKEHLLNMSYADFFYIISYPTYSGYRIEHDPTYTAYYNANAEGTAGPPNLAGLILIVAMVAIFAVIAVAVLRNRRPKKNETRQTNTPQPPQPPSSLL
jgi:hypothetical protein